MQALFRNNDIPSLKETPCQLLTPEISLEDDLQLLAAINSLITYQLIISWSRIGESLIKVPFFFFFFSKYLKAGIIRELTKAGS